MYEEGSRKGKEWNFSFLKYRLMFFFKFDDKKNRDLHEVERERDTFRIRVWWRFYSRGNDERRHLKIERIGDSRIVRKVYDSVIVYHSVMAFRLYKRILDSYQENLISWDYHETK